MQKVSMLNNFKRSFKAYIFSGLSFMLAFASILTTYEIKSREDSLSIQLMYSALGFDYGYANSLTLFVLLYLSGSAIVIFINLFWLVIKYLFFWKR